MSTAPPHTNRLAREQSPYLLQHATNPVDWYPWGAEAFARARELDRPIFLSVGYSTCHWCHVMAHESFEDPAIAAVLNALYVSIKVDREERPDVDHLYMSILVAQSGHGGWPLSVWLTPQLEPYFAGTYFPPQARRGMPGFADALRSLALAYRERKDEARSQGAMVLDWVRRSMFATEPGAIDVACLERAFGEYRAAFDRAHGGFGGAPKFPRPMCIALLLRRLARTGAREAHEMVTRTLDGMARGGMYDQLGGGFARYSTDARWLVPHFEKMLYDNALLASCYVEAYALLRTPLYARIAREVLAYLDTRMSSPAGGFYSAEDADSEGEEGKFYVWDEAEIVAALGDDADARLACAYFGVTRGGNFEQGGKSVLSRARDPVDLSNELGLEPTAVSARLDEIRARLVQARDRRVRPGTDDKVLASWNGLAVAAFARAAWVLGDPAYAHRARRAADFVEREMTSPGGGLVRTWRNGPGTIPAALDDYAFHAAGLLELYHATFDPSLVARAIAIVELVLARFPDPTTGALYQTEHAGELPIRTMDLQDNAIPSGSSAMAGVLWRLARLTHRADLDHACERLLAAHAPLLARAPHALPQMCCVLADWTHPPAELVIVGAPLEPATQALVAEVRRRYLPATVLACGDPATLDASRQVVPLLDGKTLLAGRPTAYLCRHGACERGTTDPDAWGRALDAFATGTA